MPLTTHEMLPANTPMWFVWVAGERHPTPRVCYDKIDSFTMSRSIVTHSIDEPLRQQAAAALKRRMEAEPHWQPSIIEVLMQLLPPPQLERSA